MPCQMKEGSCIAQKHERHGGAQLKPEVLNLPREDIKPERRIAALELKELATVEWF